MMAWINVDTSTDQNCVISQWGTTSTEQAAVLSFEADSQILFAVRTSTPALGLANSVGTISDATDAHVAGTHISGSQKAYINGSQDGSDNDTPGLQSVTPEPIAVGVQDAESTKINHFDGSISQAQVHTIDRSADWISDEYDQTNDNATFWGTWTWTAQAADGLPVGSLLLMGVGA